MKIRALIIPAVLIVMLSSCSSPISAPASTPTPSPTSSEAAPSPTSTASAAPTSSPVVLPGDCDSLVAADIIHLEFSPRFEPLAIAADYDDPVAQNFMARDGLTCLWGIPNSGAGITLYVAQRATISDNEQIAAWDAAGYTECISNFDACYYENVTNEVGEFWTLHTLAGGFEMRASTSAGSLDPLMATALAAATSMGYF